MEIIESKYNSLSGALKAVADAAKKSGDKTTLRQLGLLDTESLNFNNVGLAHVVTAKLPVYGTNKNDRGGYSIERYVEITCEYISVDINYTARWGHTIGINYNVIASSDQCVS